MKTYKVFVNADGRMLVAILREGGVETTKYFPDALSFRVESHSRMANLRNFIKRNKDILDSFGFKVEEIKIKEEV